VRTDRTVHDTDRDNRRRNLDHDVLRPAGPAFSTDARAPVKKPREARLRLVSMAGGTVGGQPIIPRTLRRPAGCSAAAAVLIFAILAQRYRGDSTARWLDNEVQEKIAAAGLRSSSWDFVIQFGDTFPVVALALLLGGVALTMGHRRIALLALAGPGLTGAVTTLLKPLIGRTLRGDFAYPSGHAGGATALGLVAVLLLVSALRPSGRMSAALLAAGTFVPGGIMALALVADGEHYATDTIGGFCLAVALVVSCAFFIERLTERRSCARRLG
jgi:membrane-associated phospholipid phosphatase